MQLVCCADDVLCLCCWLGCSNNPSAVQNFAMLALLHAVFLHAAVIRCSCSLSFDC